MAIPSFLTGLMTLLLFAAPVAGADDPWIEFDKKPQHNPTTPAPRTIAATGTINLPAGYKVREVTLRYYPDGEDARTRFLVKATFDEKAKTWSAKAEQIIRAGAHWVDVEVKAIGPDGLPQSSSSLDQRRVYVLDAK